MRYVLFLEDDADRVARFERAVSAIAPALCAVVWRTAWSMIHECEHYLDSTVLISLDHDLNPLPGETDDPGGGVDVASFLAGRSPACPVIVHTSNSDRSLTMIDELESAGW